MEAAATIVSIFSILIPLKGWFSPAQPLEIDVRPDAPVTLVLTDFFGKPLETKGSADVKEPTKIDARTIFPSLAAPGTYILYAVPQGKTLPDFLGTPLVIEVRADKRRNAPPGPMVTRVLPLQYALMHTKQGKITAVFYYDVAPSTAENFLYLAREGFFDGQAFHRVVPGFVIQGGDPRGDSSGGPGYMIDAEFSDRPHLEGVLSMARSGDPNEPSGMMPRSDFANSAGSQFFICLNYESTRRLDEKYTAFGRVTGGLDVVQKIGAVPTDSGQRPTEPQTIEKIEIISVTPGDNPYAGLKTQ